MQAIASHRQTPKSFFFWSSIIALTQRHAEYLHLSLAHVPREGPSAHGAVLLRQVALSTHQPPHPCHQHASPLGDSLSPALTLERLTFFTPLGKHTTRSGVLPVLNLAAETAWRNARRVAPVRAYSMRARYAPVPDGVDERPGDERRGTQVSTSTLWGFATPAQTPGGAPHAHGGAARMTSTMFARTRAAPSRLGSLSAPARAHRGVRAAAATANGAGAAGTKLDALIIGGGPAGLSTALMLKQRGCEQARRRNPRGGG